MTDKLAVVGIATLTQKVGGAGLTFLAGIAIARALGPAQFGSYAVTFAGATLAASVAGLGLPLMVTKDVATSASRGDWGRFWHAVSSAFRATLVAGCIAASLFAAYVWIAAAGTASPKMAIIAALLIPALSVNALRAAVLRGLGHPVLADFPDLAVQPAIVLLLAVIAITSASPASAHAALTWQLIAAAISLALGYVLLKSRSPRSAEHAAPRSGLEAWRDGAASSLAVTVTALLESQLALYMVTWLDGASSGGHFQAARQVVNLVSIGLVGINLPLQGKLAAAWAAGDRAEAQELTRAAARLGFAVAVLSCILLFAFAGPILLLFGDDYRVAVNALRILAIGQLLNAAAGPCGIVLAMTGHVRLAPAGVLLALLVNALVAFALMPPFGVVGAAIAACAGTATWNAIFVIRARRATGIWTPAIAHR